ncbi:MAG TPA: right-handed parallel beta-helix repeat-containing protein, partial [Spirochaetota bacterium]|nr:right-handed parallel beta-helix repeat-containing protein [Spirochaetota bacterium]
LYMKDCRVEQNNWYGLEFLRCKDVSLVDLKCLDNGANGINGGHTSNLIIRNVECSYNGWRSYFGGYGNWVDAGLKLFAGRNNLFDKVICRSNFANAFWLDSDFKDVVIKDCDFSYTYGVNEYLQGNGGNGVFLEFSQGPILLKNCKIMYNEDGVYNSAAANVTYDSCHFKGNKYSFNVIMHSRADQTTMTPDFYLRWKERPPEKNVVKNCILEDETFFHYHDVSWGDKGGYLTFLNTLKCRKNVYKTENATPFWANLGQSKTIKPVSYADWVDRVQDIGSEAKMPKGKKSKTWGKQY